MRFEHKTNDNRIDSIHFEMMKKMWSISDSAFLSLICMGVEDIKEVLVRLGIMWRWVWVLLLLLSFHLFSHKHM